jgi:4-hydroxybenzoate polyprenyltransferase
MHEGNRPVTARWEAAPRQVAAAPLLRAAHIGPTVAVTAVVALLCVAADLPTATTLVVTGAVLSGQLTIGWGNDLVDASRDRSVGRSDKPLARGDISPALVRRCLLVAAAACVVLSLMAGWRSGLTHLFLGVAFGHLYNLAFKGTALSLLPYAVAFGCLPAVVSLAADPPAGPPAWMVATASALGVAAHFLNTLPDLDDDAATGIRGLPHRIGATASRVVATVLLVGASATAVLGPSGPPGGGVWVALGLVATLAVVALVGRGKAPFYAAIAIALADVALLVAVAA